MMIQSTALQRLVRIPIVHGTMEGMLELPENATGLVLFAHGSGSSRHSPRNNYVASVLRQNSIATLLMDLLTPEEDEDYESRFDIQLLTNRLLTVTRWIKEQEELQNLPIGYFGASTGAAAAIQAAARAYDIKAIVSRGGRPDLAGVNELNHLQCPTLLLVGGNDSVVIELNYDAYGLMCCVKDLVIIPGATHLFEEPGTLEEVARQAAAWFGRYLNV
jgi:putative phosphoribosyl transferase